MEVDLLLFFLFQAEDGIRDYKVTGVQTCALPLTGQQPASFSLAARTEEVLPSMPEIDAGLPSQLLERRPDVAAAERRVAAANANIGVARAAYFPVFDLMAQLGSQASSGATWLTAPSEFWSIGPQAVLTLFDGGLHRAQSAAAH